MALFGLPVLAGFLRLNPPTGFRTILWMWKRGRFLHEVRIFGWVLALIAERGLVRGERISVDTSTLEANAALRAIVHRDTGEGYRAMLERMAQESGMRTPTAEDLTPPGPEADRHRAVNDEWISLLMSGSASRRALSGGLGSSPFRNHAPRRRRRAHASSARSRCSGDPAGPPGLILDAPRRRRRRRSARRG